jgi:hypothetical protein
MWERRQAAGPAAPVPGARGRCTGRSRGRTSWRCWCCSIDTDTPIAQLLRGASLVVARHSNVCLDAVQAGVPFEAEDGAAVWLQRREFTPANRLEFLQRLAWWQWRAAEAPRAWQFLKGMVGCA